MPCFGLVLYWPLICELFKVILWKKIDLWLFEFASQLDPLLIEASIPWHAAEWIQDGYFVDDHSMISFVSTLRLVFYKNPWLSYEKASSTTVSFVLGGNIFQVYRSQQGVDSHPGLNLPSIHLCFSSSCTTSENTQEWWWCWELSVFWTRFCPTFPTVSPTNMEAFRATKKRYTCFTYWGPYYPWWEENYIPQRVCVLLKIMNWPPAVVSRAAP